MNKPHSKLFGNSLNGCEWKCQPPKMAVVAGTDLQVADRILCVSPSTFVGREQKTSDLIKVYSATDLRQTHSPTLQQAALEVKGILEHQQRIIEMVDTVNEKISCRKDFGR